MAQPIDYVGYFQNQNMANPFLEGLQSGAAVRQVLDRQQAELKAQQLQEQYAKDLNDTLNNPTAQKFAELTLKYPQQREAFKQSWETLDKSRQDQEFLIGSKAFNALNANKPELAKSLLDEQIVAARNSNMPVTKLEAMRETLDSDPKVIQAQLGLILSNVNPDKWKKIADESREATLFPVLQKQKQVELAKAGSQAQIAAIEAKYADKLNEARLKKAVREVESESTDNVQSSTIKPDGTVVIVTKKGLTRVIGPDGVELTGQSRVDAVRDAEKFGADVQALRSGARKAGEIGQAEAQKAFTSVGKIRQNLSNLDSAIAALDAGASSGVIASKFPNWKASTIELQNVQRQLGLDVIGSVTFGALSEGELSLALETALPLNMQEQDLKKWLQDKKQAQSKLSDYLSEQARFLSVPGRTIGDWMDRAEKMGQQTEQPVRQQQMQQSAQNQPASTSPISVRLPTGQIITFPNKQAADQFKRAAGIQ